MTDDTAPNLLFYGLLLVLPVMALVTRRVPVMRLLGMLLLWAAIFVAGLALVAQRERFAPALAKVTALLGLDEQTVTGKEVRIRLSDDGHFWARVTIDGVARRLLIDSGATVTALSPDTARRAGLKPRAGRAMMLRTANGTITAQVATVGDLKLGDIVARDVAVAVSSTFAETEVLGMNFLSRLQSWRVEGETLILVPHHPHGLT